MAANAEGLDVCVNLDAHMEVPYHGDPNTVAEGPRQHYAQWLNTNQYGLWAKKIADQYPFIRWFQILNEPYYQIGPQLSNGRYTEMVRAVVTRVPQKVMASVTPYRGILLDEWTKDPMLKDVIAGFHLHILHRFSDPATYYESFMAEATNAASRYPNREFWVDETNAFGARHPGNPDGSVGNKAYGFMQAHVEAIDTLYFNNVIQGAGLGFCGGLEKPCSPRWKVCAAYIDQYGNLTNGGMGLIDSAKSNDWWDTSTMPGNNNDQTGGGEEVDSYARELIRRLARNELRYSKDKITVDEYEEELQDIRDAAKRNTIGTSPNDSVMTRGLNPQEIDAYAYFHEIPARVAIRKDSGGFFADWRDIGNNAHHDGPFPGIVEAVDHLKSKGF